MESPRSSAPRRKINILRVITWLPIGGIERRLVAVLPRLDRERFNVRLVCLRERGALADELEAAGIPVDVIPFRKRWDLRALRRLAGYMREHQTDLVHSHMYRSNVPATVAARLAGVRTVWGQVHNVGTWETARQAWMDRQLCRWRTGMIAVSERVRQDVIERLRLAPERVELIYNGVELERFAGAATRRAELRSRFLAEHLGEGGAAGGTINSAMAPEPVIYLFAARLVEQKRATDFLEALGRIQAALGKPSAALNAPGVSRPLAWILGDGPLREALERQAAALPDPAAVRFFGKVGNVEEFMAAADVFVLPSTKEGFSNAIIEALAAGLPVIASDVGGNAEAVREGAEGFIIPPLAVERLTEAMAALHRDRARRQAMAAAAADRARCYSLDRMIAQVEALYTRSAAR